MVAWVHEHFDGLRARLPEETLGYLGGVWNAPIPYSPVQTIDLNGDGKPDVLLMEYGMT